VLDLRRREIVESGIDDGVGIEGCEQRVQVRVGLEQGGFTVVVGGRQGRELNVDAVVSLSGVGRNLSLCLAISISFARSRGKKHVLSPSKSKVVLVLHSRLIEATKAMASTCPTTFFAAKTDFTSLSLPARRRRRWGVDLETVRSSVETPGCDTTR
jgi:hypothetical protein